MRRGKAVNRWHVQPLQTLEAELAPGRCPDKRCGEDFVMAVPHPDDPEQVPNRCPTCLTTVEPYPKASDSGEQG